MRKAILILSLAAVSSNAMAEWVKINDVEGKLTQYIDPATSRKNGNKIKMWRMLDFKTPQEVVDGKPYMSSKTQIEYDCNEEQERTLVLVVYSGNMGTGNVVHMEYDVGEWIPIAPGSIGEDPFNFVCK